MKTRKGYVQGYNAQAAVSEDQIVVECEVVQDCHDFGQLKPMVELTEANLYEIGEEPGKFLADAGYCSENNLEYLARPGAPEPYVAVKKDHKQRVDDEPDPAATDGTQTQDLGGESVLQASRSDRGGVCSAKSRTVESFPGFCYVAWKR